LGLTVIVGFAIAALGKEAGLFGSSGSDGAPEAAAEAPVVPPTALPTVAPTATPIVIQQVVYRDEYVPGSSSSSGGDGSSSRQSRAPPPAATSSGGGGATTAPTSPPAPPANTPADDGFHSQSAEFEGQIVSASGNQFVVSGEHGDYSMTVTAQTRVHGGALVAGAFVSVHARSIPGDVWVANEIEVHGGGGEHEEEGD
jgi:hypothetical protein